LQSAPGSDLNVITVGDIATSIHDVDFPGTTSFASAFQTFGAPVLVYRITIERTGGIIAGSNLTLRDAKITNVALSQTINVGTGTHLSLDRVVISGGTIGIGENNAGAIVDISNLLVYGTSGAGLNLPTATGRISFSTIADTGLSGSTPRSVNCASGLTVSSSIIWTSSGTGTPIGGGCTFNTVIAGPTAVAGTQNTDPQFKDRAHNDYHLAATSPAKDVVDSGPTQDFEGDPRPQGVRFDIGADEAPP
jgi:hypothetical protein